jgi:hypothetical protein
MDMENENEESETLTEGLLNALLLKMGFVLDISKIKDQEAIYTQKRLTSRLFAQLNGRDRAYVTLNNSRMFFFAI